VPSLKVSIKVIFGVTTIRFSSITSWNIFLFITIKIFEMKESCDNKIQVKSHWTYENSFERQGFVHYAALSKTIFFRSNSAKFWFSLTMLLIISNHTPNSVKRLRYSVVIFQIKTLTWRRAILHITWQKVRKELFHWTVSGSQNLILLANILTTNKSRVPNLLSFTIVFVEQK